MVRSNVTDLQLDHLEAAAALVVRQVEAGKLLERTAIAALAGQMVNLIEVIRSLHISPEDQGN